jgi:hypothetical protein
MSYPVGLPGLAILSLWRKAGGCRRITRRLARLYRGRGGATSRQNSQPQIARLPVGAPTSVASSYPVQPLANTASVRWFGDVSR